MRIHQYQLKMHLCRFLCALLFAAVLGLGSDCQAQHQRGWLSRGSRIQNRVRLFENRFQPAQAETKNPGGNELRTTPRRSYNSQDWRTQDWRSQDWRTYDQTTGKYPKYIGGFHASQIHNIGVPSGDIGFRGNGIYWSPW